MSPGLALGFAAYLSVAALTGLLMARIYGSPMGAAWSGPLATAVALAAAASFFLVLGRERRARRATLVLLGTGIALAPLLVPPDAPVVRLMVAILCVSLLLKLHDLHVGADLGERPSLGTFLSFLVDPFSYVLRRLHREPVPDRRREWIRLVRGLVEAGVAAGALVWLVLLPWEGVPFLVEHVAKVLPFGALGFAGGDVVVASVRLSGGTMRAFTDAPLVSTTPAEFWRRYNRGFQQYFFEDLFRRLGGRRRPALAILSVFALSALIHEYVFGMVIGRVQGYQTAFFMLHGVAVAATARSDPRGPVAVLSTAATVTFLLLSTVLFFASFQEVVPFYARGLPSWLAGW